MRGSIPSSPFDFIKYQPVSNLMKTTQVFIAVKIRYKNWQESQLGWSTLWKTT